MRRLLPAAMIAMALLGCAEAPVTGRKQLMLIPADMVARSSAQAYYNNLKPFKETGRLDSDPRLAARVSGITRRIVREATGFNPSSRDWRWESHVVDTDELNAYCMPGGRMVIYTGLVKRLKLSDEEIAAVMAHEVGHAIANHGAEQLSAALGMEIVLAALADNMEPEHEAALAAGAALLVKLPHSRLQENEADRIGIHLMSLAGYHPSGAVSLMKKFQAVLEGKTPPEFLSDHPSDAHRIASLDAVVADELPYYEAGLARRKADESRPAGHKP